MRILHIVAGLPMSGGGLSELVPMFCRYLCQLHHEVTLATLNGPVGDATQKAEQDGVILVKFAPSWPATLYFSWQMAWSLAKRVKQAEVIHVHSNWTFPVWWGCHCALKAGKPLVMSPQGCLDPVRLQHSAWKKRFAGLFDRYFLRRATVIHATCEVEVRWIEAYVGAPSRGRTVVIPNGVAVEDFSGRGGKEERRALFHCCNSTEAGSVDTGSQEQGVQTNERVHSRTDELPRTAGRTRTVLYVGRLHPLKGLELLLDAWKLAAADYPGWVLQVIGPDEQGTKGRLVAQAARLGLKVEDKCVQVLVRDCLSEPAVETYECGNSDIQALSPDIVFAGPVYGADKQRALAAADLFVLPTRSENFGIVVAEALACGVPVITTKGAPWAELENCGNAFARECVNGKDGNQASQPVRAGWWVDIGVAPLADALREAMSLSDEERRAMGENGRRLVEARYRWETVAQRMAEVYEKCANAGLR